MIVIKIRSVHLMDRAEQELTKRAWDKASEWLTFWTPDGNFKWYLADDLGHGLDLIRAELKKSLLPGWLADQGIKVGHFGFQVHTSKVEDGCFWPPGTLYNGTVYPIE